MAFKSFFLKRKKVTILNWLTGQKQTFHPQLGKISYIEPNQLQLVPYSGNLNNQSLPGVPFDMEALYLSVDRNPQESIMSFIFSQLEILGDTNEPLVLICGGSTVGNEVPFMIISPNQTTIQFGQDDPAYPFGKNVYQLCYRATA